MFGLEKKTIENIRTVFKFFPEVEEVIIYGSRAKGNNKTGSDIDLTLKGEHLNHAIINRISLKLDDLYLPFTFDLSILSHIDNPDLTEHIKRVGKVFYRKTI